MWILPHIEDQGDLLNQVYLSETKHRFQNWPFYFFLQNLGAHSKTFVFVQQTPGPMLVMKCWTSHHTLHIRVWLSINLRPWSIVWKVWVVQCVHWVVSPLWGSVGAAVQITVTILLWQGLPRSPLVTCLLTSAYVQVPRSPRSSVTPAWAPSGVWTWPVARALTAACPRSSGRCWSTRTPTRCSSTGPPSYRHSASRVSRNLHKCWRNK